MPSFKHLLRATALAILAAQAAAVYTLQDNYDSNSFFSGFDFFSGPDPTHGHVQYVTNLVANNSALAGYSSGAVYLGVDSTNVAPNGRESVRLESKKTYTQGLFIADISHMPGSICGVWPAFWTFGNNWPAGGEIDIIEGVHTQASNAMTLHTADGCTMSNAGSRLTSSLVDANCNADNGFKGCGQKTTEDNTYGSGFNAIGGGVYAMEWTEQAIRIFFFPRNAIPADITSGQPNPESWGQPQAAFSGSGCDITHHFTNHKIVFDTTFCGDWAGQPSIWGQECAAATGAATCNEFVSNAPEAFREAYWLIDSVKVYKQTGTARRGVVAKPFMA